MSMSLESVWAMDAARERFSEMVSEVTGRAIDAFPATGSGIDYVLRIGGDGRPWVKVVRPAMYANQKDVLLGSVYYHINTDEVIVWREAK